MRTILSLTSIALCAAFLVGGDGKEPDFRDPFFHWPVQLRLAGSVVFGENFDDLSKLEDALSDAELGASVGLLLDGDIARSEFVAFSQLFHRSTDFRVVRRQPNGSFDKLSELASGCRTFVWRSSRRPEGPELSRLLDHREELVEILNRGGTIVFLGPAATSLATHFTTSSRDSISVTPGLGLLPSSLIHFDGRPRDRDQIIKILETLPATVGIAMPRNLLIRITERTLAPIGDGSVTLMLPSAGEAYPEVRKFYRQRRSRRDSANECFADWTQWRRRAINRQISPFPVEHPPEPNVANGTLIIVGGGLMPEGLMKQFVALAGGARKAKLVYIPCSESPAVSAEQSTVEQWKRMGVRHATFIHTKDRIQANEDEAFLQPLKEATGIWFGGGRQWNFADSYYGTRAQMLIKEVLARGGVVGGSSAGASIQASFLARATPIENLEIIAPGYLRGGLGLIEGVAIDQHFSQRGRQKDLRRLVTRFPQMLGIGIDESTALIVEKSIGRIVGEGEVYFYQALNDHGDILVDHTQLGAGRQYDLATRKPLSGQTDEVMVPPTSDTQIHGEGIE